MPNVFSQTLNGTPREAINWKLGFAILCFGLMGASRGERGPRIISCWLGMPLNVTGIDEGLISGTVQQKSFIAKYNLKDPNLNESERASKLGNIAAMVQIGSIAGALL